MRGYLENLRYRISMGKEKIESTRKWIKNKEKQLLKKDGKARISLGFQIHHKKRKLSSLLENQSHLEEDLRSKKYRVCFGGKKLFREQFHLLENGYSSHKEWKQVWEAKRQKSFFLIGSKDETSGNQSATLMGDQIRIRVPNQLVDIYGKYYIFRVEYKYGKEWLEDALERHSAISHRFECIEGKVYLYSSFDLPEIEVKTRAPKQFGALGVDFNADHIAISEVDRMGNLVETKTLPTEVLDKSQEQTEAIYGDVISEIIQIAKEKSKALVIEDLDFSQKKASLKEESKRKARILSQLAYGLFLEGIKRKAYKEGVEVISVNPAFTSFIGRIKYQGRYGLTSHESAAFVIARRGLDLREKPPAINACEGLAKISHQHEWRKWAFLRKDPEVKKHLRDIFRFWRPLQGTISLSSKECVRTFGEILQMSGVCGTG